MVAVPDVKPGLDLLVLPVHLGPRDSGVFPDLVAPGDSRATLDDRGIPVLMASKENQVSMVRREVPVESLLETKGHLGLRVQWVHRGTVSQVFQVSLDPLVYTEQREKAVVLASLVSLGCVIHPCAMVA